jgi:hypothetical protein
MRNIVVATLFALTTIMVNSQEAKVAKISALSDGTILLNGAPADASAVDAEFTRLKKVGGAVWYYRQNADQEPNPKAMSIVELIVKHRLPVSMSTKPDFSDYVDGNGHSKTRDQ